MGKRETEVKTVRIRNEKLYCVSRREAKTVSGQIEKYFTHGITVGAGNVVFDVGANIGLFSRHVMTRVEKTARVYAFEPVPILFRALEKNISGFGNIKAFNSGISAEPGSTDFLYYPNAGSISTMYGQNSPEELIDPVLEIIKNPESDFYRYRSIRLLPAGITRFIIGKILKNIMTPVKIRSTIRTLSEIIAEQEVDRIDLLKIDVEKAELDVLNGLSEKHLSLVRQLVMEVHDISGRVNRIKDRLEKNGFRNIIFEQDTTVPSVEDIYMMYAARG